MKNFKFEGLAVEIWIIVAVGAAIVLAGLRYLLLLREREHGEEEATTEQIDIAIAFYKRELLNTLEIFSGEAKNEDPQLFLSEIPRAVQILVHIETLYRRKGVFFDARGIHTLFCEVEDIASNNKIWDAPEAKGVDTPQLADVMSRIRSFVTCTMP